jgi:hypothetical protein
MKGMTSGGHLVLYDSLHLTENIRTYDKSRDADNVKRGGYATNETHAIDRQLIRMMLAMPYLVKHRGENSQIKYAMLMVCIYSSFLSSIGPRAYVDGVQGQGSRERRRYTEARGVRLFEPRNTERTGSSHGHHRRDKKGEEDRLEGNRERTIVKDRQRME